MRPHNLEALKTAAASDLAHPDFRNIRWAGIFGSFSRGTATESSDVDVVVIEAPYDWSVTKQLLEDVLPVAWSRSVDVIHISEGQTDFRGYIQLESLLASRTIFLRDHAARDEVSRLRTLAKQTVDKGQALYSGVASRIDAVRRLVDQVSLQDFVGWPKEQHVDILSQVSLILGDLDIQPKHHAMREAFWYAAIKDAETLSTRLKDARRKDAEAADQDKGPGATTLRTVWEMLTTTERHQGLEFIARMTRKHVLLQLVETRILGEEAEDIYKVEL